MMHDKSMVIYDMMCYVYCTEKRQAHKLKKLKLFWAEMKWKKINKY